MKISKKLGVNLYYFINLITFDQYEFVEHSKKTIRDMIKEKNYKEVQRLVNKLKNHPVMQQIEDQQFIQWHYGICAYYLEKDFNKSIEILKNTLTMDQTIQPTEQNIHILNSIAVIYSELESWEQSKSFFLQAINLFEKSIYPMDMKILIKICYKLSKTLYKLEMYDAALSKIKKGINLAKEYETNYLFGELFYQGGLILISMKSYEKSLTALELANTFFTLLEKQSYIKITNEKIKLVKDNMMHEFKIVGSNNIKGSGSDPS